VLACHEVGHKVLPWQASTMLYVDDEHTLDPEVKERFETRGELLCIGGTVPGVSLRTRCARPAAPNSISNAFVEALWQFSTCRATPVRENEPSELQSSGNQLWRRETQYNHPADFAKRRLLRFI